MEFDLLDIRTLILVGCGLKLVWVLSADSKRMRILVAAGLALDLAFLVIGDLVVLDGSAALWLVLAGNVVLALAFVREHTTMGFTKREKRLFSVFETLTPGQLRQVLRLARVHHVTSASEVIHEGSAPPDLLLIEGFRFQVKKGAEMSEAKGPAFAGEIAFLTGQPASATVIVPPGTPYLAWEVGALHGLMRSNPGLKNALVARFSLDLAAKVARSMPRPR